MKKEILIVGGTGFIGYHLAKFAKKKLWSVTIISTKKPRKIRKLKNVTYLKCDITKQKQINKFIKKDFNYVVNLGGYVDHSNKRKTFNSHYYGCKNLADFFLKKNLESFIQIGSGGEYGKLKSPHKEKEILKPLSIYSKAKYLSSKYLLNLFKKKNFPTTIIRLYQVYGPRQDMNRFLPIVINNCIKDKKFPCSHGRQFRDFIYIDDVVEAIFKSLKKNEAKGEIINIGSNKPLKIKDLIFKIIKIIGKGKPEFGKIILRKEENLITYPNIFKAKKIINWKPKISFEKGLKKTINFYVKKKI